MKRFLKQPTLYLAVLILGSSAGCTYLGDREATQVQPSPLEQATDIISKVKGVQVQNADQVQDQVEATPLGKTLELEVNRNGLTQIITVKPEQLPAAAST